MVLNIPVYRTRRAERREGMRDDGKGGSKAGRPGFDGTLQDRTTGIAWIAGPEGRALQPRISAVPAKKEGKPSQGAMK